MAVDEKIGGVPVNYAIVFLSGLVLTIASILIFLLIMKAVFGNYDIKDIMPTPANLSYAFKNKEANIGILYSTYTEDAVLSEGSTWISDNVDAWERYAKTSKMYYQIIYDMEIEEGNLEKFNLIILPGTKALSDRQIGELRKYMEQGGSLLITGGIATFSEEGKWRGWKVFTELLGLKFTKEIEPKEIYKVHTLRGSLPITAGIPTGYALKIATWDRPIYAEIKEPRTIQASMWYDFRREAGLVRDEIDKSAGIAYGSYGEGRFVWFGFELTSIIGEKQEDYINFNKLFINSINWLLYEPIAYIKDWPPPFDAAAVFVPSIDENPSNARNLLDILKSTQFPATFVVSPNTAVENSTLLKRLAKFGEFAAVVDIGYMDSATDTVNKLFDIETQKASISTAKNELEAIVEKPVTGIAPLNSFIDDNTLISMADESMDFFITDSLTDRSVPKVIIRNEQPILQITKTARDDYEIIREYGLTIPQYQTYTYLEDVDRVLYEGGLYVLKLHTEYQLQPQYVKVVNDVLRYVRQKNMWLTSINELKDWWLKRGRVELEYFTNSKVRMEVKVTNLSDETIDSFVIEVLLNKKISQVEISSDLVNTVLPKYELESNNNTLFLFIDNLEGGESRSYFLDYENMETASRN